MKCSLKRRLAIAIDNDRFGRRLVAMHRGGCRLDRLGRLMALRQQTALGSELAKFRVVVILEAWQGIALIGHDMGIVLLKITDAIRDIKAR